MSCENARLSPDQSHVHRKPIETNALNGNRPVLQIIVRFYSSTRDELGLVETLQSSLPESS